MLAGEVRVAGSPRPRPGDPVRGEPAIEVRRPPRFASRGGLKLEAALERWPIPVEGAVCADLGASTGGFTDCLLQHGARRVYAIDVGHGQLALRLRDDDRVVAMDRTNARYLERGALPEAVSVVTADLAFISLTRVAPAIAALLGEGGHSLCLVKPQFEAGRARVGRRGVVRDPAVWREVIVGVARSLAASGLGARDVAASPLLGPEGNAEFLLWCATGGGALGEDALGQAVARAAAAVAGRIGSGA